jgi:hypothetical protein
MAIKQTSKQAKIKTEAKVDTGPTNTPITNNEREPQYRNPWAR